MFTLASALVLPRCVQLRRFPAASNYRHELASESDFSLFVFRPIAFEHCTFKFSKDYVYDVCTAADTKVALSAYSSKVHIIGPLLYFIVP